MKARNWPLIEAKSWRKIGFDFGPLFSAQTNKRSPVCLPASCKKAASCWPLCVPPTRLQPHTETKRPFYRFESSLCVADKLFALTEGENGEPLACLRPRAVCGGKKCDEQAARKRDLRLPLSSAMVVHSPFSCPFPAQSGPLMFGWLPSANIDSSCHLVAAGGRPVA